MGVDPETGPAGDLLGEGGEAEVADLGAPTASGAHDMVMMGRFAGDVGVLAGRQVEPLDEAEPREQVERSEDRRSPDARAPPAPVGDEVGRREVAVAAVDERRYRAAGLRHAMTGPSERLDEEGLACHAVMILSII